MLVEFRFKTEPLFPEEQVLSLVTSKEKRIEENVFQTEVKNIPRLLKSAVIYGANGHGKSTILNYFINFIDWISGKKDYFPLYSYSGSYEVTFIIKGIIYVYHVDREGTTIVLEELQRYKGGRRIRIFKRTFDKESDRYEIKIGKGFPEYNYLTQTNLTDTDLLFHSLPKSFLSTWLRKNIIGVSSAGGLPGCLGLEKDVKTYEKIKTFLQHIDCGIDNFRVDVSGKEVEFHFPNNPSPWNWVRTDLLPSGIRWLMQRLYFILDALKHGKLLVLDDLGNGLHPSLAAYIVDLFHNPETNPKNAQLIFTTHCTHLLDTKFIHPRAEPALFRRDQVWLVAHSGYKKQTVLYSLSEFKEVKGDYDHIEKDYLLGCYGAIPCLV